MDKVPTPKPCINFANGNELQQVADARAKTIYGQQVDGFQANKSPS